MNTKKQSACGDFVFLFPALGNRHASSRIERTLRRRLQAVAERRSVMARWAREGGYSADEEWKRNCKRIDSLRNALISNFQSRSPKQFQ